MLSRFVYNKEIEGKLIELLDYMTKEKFIYLYEKDENGDIYMDEYDMEKVNKLIVLIESGYSKEEVEKVSRTLYKKVKKNKENIFTIGVFSKKLDVTRRTVDFWIEKGLLEPFTMGENGPKYFTDEDLSTAKIITDLKLANFSLEEIKSLSNVISSGDPKLAPEKLKELEDRMKKMKKAIASIEKNVIPNLKELMKNSKKK